MAIKKCVVDFTRQYIIEIDEKASDEYIKNIAKSEFNNDISFGLIDSTEDNFKCEIIIKYDKRT